MKAETHIRAAVRRKSTIVSAIDAAEHLGLALTVECVRDSVRALIAPKDAAGNGRQ